MNDFVNKKKKSNLLLAIFILRISLFPAAEGKNSAVCEGKTISVFLLAIYIITYSRKEG